MIKKSIVWFKTDLRLLDNETLIHAIAHSDEVIPIYCFDDAHFISTEFGFKKTGNFRAQFILESLQDLDKNLRELGSGLIIVKGKPEIELCKIAHQYHAQKVFAKKEVAYEELITEAKVESELWKQKITFDTFSTSTLYHAQDLPFTIKDIPDIFTNFRKQIDRETSVRKVFEKPSKINSPKIPDCILPTLLDLGLEKPVFDQRVVLPFKGGETEALKRLNYYSFETKAISTYKSTRNGLIGDLYSTKFSAWLALGCISARSIYTEIKKYEKQFKANESTYWVVFELMWRDYFRFMMKKYRHKFFLQNGIKAEEKPLQIHDQKSFDNWENGTTGIDFIDANMKELKLTGFMSNRGRQNVASFLINDLKLDWRYGAAYFEQQLIDYDVCSNWGNWAYLAGVGNDPREDRYFNIEKQASIYDADKKYRTLWLQ
jgi:deoxyribodipyrimidine photo-lyase